MGKAIRFLAVLAGIVIIVALGIQGTAWANRLGIGAPAPTVAAATQSLPTVAAPAQVQPTAAAPAPVLPAAGRPQGTVPLPPPTVTITPGHLALVGNCATAFMATAPAGVIYTATVVDQTDLPAGFPGNLLSCGIRIDAQPVSAALGAEIELCFPIPPTKMGLAFDHDLQQWVRTTETPNNGQSCVKLPVDNPNPTFAALFEQ